MTFIDDSEAPFWQHVEDLRRTLIACISIIFLGFCCALYYHPFIFGVLQSSLRHPQTEVVHERIQLERITNNGSSDLVYEHYHLAPGQSILIEKTVQPELAVFGPIEGMLITFKTAFWVGLVGTSPLWLYFIFRFVAPGLAPSFRTLIFPFLVMSCAFMLLGIYFAFRLTLPLANQYLTGFNAGLGTNLWGLANYIDYTIVVLLGNGLAFEVFVIGIFLLHYGKINYRHLIHFRRYFIVVAFIASALLTPPDVLTQLMLAIPLMVLYEMCVLYGWLKGQAA